MNIKIIASVVLFSLLCACDPASDSNPIYYYDAHTQLPLGVTEADVLNRMAINTVAVSQISARGGTTGSAITSFAATHPGQIRAMIKVKGNDYINDTDSYYTRLEAQGMSADWHALGEVLIYHAEKGGGRAPEIDVPLSDNRVEAARMVAVNRGWPLIIHIEFAALGAVSMDRRNATMIDLKNYLDANPALPIVLIHMGQLEAPEVQTLLHAHPNLYFMTSHANPAVTDISSQPWTEMFVDGGLKTEWKDLIIEYPDRFIFALDNVWPEHWDFALYASQMNYWKAAVSSMPADVGHAFAHRNAERLWVMP